MDTYIRKGAARTLADGALSVLMALITPLLEKNPAKALATPAVAQRLSEQGMDIVGGPPEELDRFVRTEISRWAAVVKENHIKAGGPTQVFVGQLPPSPK